MEYAYYIMPTMNITQGYDTGFHKGSFALDNAGEDTGIDYVLAPFSGTIKQVLNKSYGIWVWLESDKPVICANGETTYLTAMFGHDNKVRHKVGDKIKQGEKFLAEGTSGNTTGNHCHLELGKGHFVNGGWYKNKDGVYMIYNAVKPNEYLFIKDDTIIKNDGGYTWKKVPTNNDIYIVKKGDTLSAIARKYNTTYPKLAKINKIKNPDLIYPGQIIKLK